MQSQVWRIIDVALQALGWIIIIDVILSYIPSVSRRNPVVALIRQISRAITSPLRKILPPQRIGDAYVDFSPVLAILAILVLRRILGVMLLGR